MSHRIAADETALWDGSDIPPAFRSVQVVRRRRSPEERIGRAVLLALAAASVIALLSAAASAVELWIPAS